MAQQDGSRMELTDLLRENLRKTVCDLASSGERVLAYATLELTTGQPESLKPTSADGQFHAAHPCSRSYFVD